MDEHIIEAMGKAKVVIRDGKVVEVGEPQIEYCPLFHKYRGIEEITKETIKENMEFRINSFGMCTPNREVEIEDLLSFGISETISTLLKEEIIDCVVMVCDGCGTVLVKEPEKAQGIGGRVSGYVKTSPIPEIIENVGKENVLNPKTAEIDQIAGLNLAIKKGYKNIAVTIASAEDGKKIRDIEKENSEIEVYIFSVHSSGVNKTEAEELSKYCDVSTGCASKCMRDKGENKAIFKVGESIPIFAFTENGKHFLEKRLEKIGKKEKKKDPQIPKPLI
jgi:putative methanogenesis marker protein 8